MELRRQLDHEEVELGEEALQTVHLLGGEVVELYLVITPCLMEEDVFIVIGRCLPL